MFNKPGYPRHRRFRLFFVPAIIVLFFAATAAVQYLWNAILPQVIHVGILTYWQSAGVLLLCRILFGRFHFGGRGGYRGGGRPGFGGHIPDDMGDKWMNMSDEEKARFKTEFRERRGHWKR